MRASRWSHFADFQIQIWKQAPGSLVGRPCPILLARGHYPSIFSGLIACSSGIGCSSHFAVWRSRSYATLAKTRSADRKCLRHSDCSSARAPRSYSIYLAHRHSAADLPSTSSMLSGPSANSWPTSHWISRASCAARSIFLRRSRAPRDTLSSACIARCRRNTGRCWL